MELFFIISNSEFCNNEEQKAWVKWLNDSLDELRDEDFFGTEAQNDPRGDNRDDSDEEIVNKGIVPITPVKVTEQLESCFPEFVINGINEAIKKYSLGKESFTINQDNVIKEIMKGAPVGFRRDKLFENHWLDFEILYQKFGWIVIYDGPAYCESYEPFYKFKAKRK